MPAPKAALAPAWKFVPVTVTVRFAPWTPVLGDTLEIVGMNGTVALALAEAPAAKLAVGVELAPVVSTERGSAATTQRAPAAGSARSRRKVRAMTCPGQ